MDDGRGGLIPRLRTASSPLRLASLHVSQPRQRPSLRARSQPRNPTYCPPRSAHVDPPEPARMSGTLPPKEDDLAHTQMSEAQVNRVDEQRGATVHVSPRCPRIMQRTACDKASAKEEPGTVYMPRMVRAELGGEGEMKATGRHRQSEPGFPPARCSSGTFPRYPAYSLVYQVTCHSAVGPAGRLSRPRLNSTDRLIARMGLIPDLQTFDPDASTAEKKAEAGAAKAALGLPSRKNQPAGGAKGTSASPELIGFELVRRLQLLPERAMLILRLFLRALLARPPQSS
jgi:hypothetical protein